jgi:hypothetical protein
MERLFDLSESDLTSGIQFFDPEATIQLLFRFVLTCIVTGILIHFFYYPKSKRRDYYFTFSLISVSIYLLIFLLGSVKLKIGFALGIFAIFGIIRYRTEAVPIREMTYLFVITAIAVINGLSVQISYIELFIVNFLFILATWILENERYLKHVSTKLILYDKIDLILPERREELIADIKKRTGLDIVKVEIGHVDFIRDAAFIKVYYNGETREINSVDTVTRFPRENE